MTALHGQRVSVAIGVLATGVAFPVLAQEGETSVVVVPQEVICSACWIELVPSHQLMGEFEDEAATDRAQFVVQVMDGRTFAVYDSNNGEVQVHGPDGSLQKKLGRPGEGPGEFRYVNHLFLGDGNKLYVFDKGLGRRSVFNIDSGELLRTDPIPSNAVDAVVLASGDMIFSGPAYERETAGYPLHLFSEDGSWKRSFGLISPALRPGSGRLLIRQMAMGSDGSVWAASPNEFRVELWSLDGKRIRALVGDRDFFEPWEEFQSRSLDTPPSSGLWDVSLDEQGRLWVIMSVAAPTWADALDPKVLDPMLNPTIKPGARYIDSVVEVIDLERGRVLARRTFPHTLGGFARPGVLWRTWIDELGFPRVEMANVRLQGG